MNALSLGASTVLALLWVSLAIAVAVFVLQVFLSVLPARRGVLPPTDAESTRSPLVVVLPAHDEASGIARTLLGVKTQLRPHDRMLVVADNCSDATAQIARDTGAEVVERFHETLRGKGFALAHGIDALRDAPPRLVVILDADCDLGPGALDALAFCVATTGRPAQALYLMTAPATASLSRRLAEFAWRVRNLVRPAGWHRVGMPCQLMGTGMAFTWAMLRDAPLANASIVEDMKLGIDLASRGQSPVFCAEALVTSTFPDSAKASKTQRTRWEHGHLEMIMHEVPGMVWRGLVRADPRLVAMALDLCVPPLALLGALLVLSAILAGALALLTSHVGILVANLGLMATFAAGALAAWALQGRDLVTWRELLSIPAYILAKVPIYAAFLRRRQKHWVRTDRGDE